jgi:hypothetical protein
MRVLNQTQKDKTMTRRIFSSLWIVVLLLSACNLPSDLANTLPANTEKPSVQNTVTAEPTASQVPPALALDHQPLYWFAPLPLEEVDRGSVDFMDLFTPDADWNEASSHLQVYKLYGGWAERAPFNQLKQAIQAIRQRGLGLAIEHSPLYPDQNCGKNIEGFAGSGFINTVRRVKDAGGTLNYIALDEPYYYAHFYDGEQACHWTTEKIAKDVGDMILMAQKIFPDMLVGDIEPVTGPADAAAYKAWLETFREVNGFDLAFFHLDMDWSNSNWPAEALEMEAYGNELNIPIGIIYTGNPFDESDENWVESAGERVKRYELEAGGQPDHVIFQSWHDKPAHALPESTASTFTGFVKTYFEDKNLLGFNWERHTANLALGKNVQVSLVMAGFDGKFAVDGDSTTIWNSGKDAPQWIEIDLGQPYDIGAIRLLISQYPAGQTVHRFLAKGPGAGEQFVELMRFEGFSEDGQWLESPATGPWSGIQFVRIETVTSPSWVAWREIEIINANAP